MFQLAESIQSAKSNSGISLFAIAARLFLTSASRIMATLTELRADDWELRCRYNQSHLSERWQADEFHTEFGKPGSAHPKSGQPPNTISQIAYYFDKATNDQVAKVHFFLLETGKIGASGKHDPKGLLLGGIKYRQRKGPEINRDPSLRFPVGERRDAYRRFRRWCCCVFGPDADRFFASLNVISLFGTWMMRRVKSAKLLRESEC